MWRKASQQIKPHPLLRHQLLLRPLLLLLRRAQKPRKPYRLQRKAKSLDLL
jgi:hypothetical protein